MVILKTKNLLSNLLPRKFLGKKWIYAHCAFLWEFYRFLLCRILSTLDFEWPHFLHFPKKKSAKHIFWTFKVIFRKRVAMLSKKGSHTETLWSEVKTAVPWVKTTTSRPLRIQETWKKSANSIYILNSKHFISLDFR